MCNTSSIVASKLAVQLFPGLCQQSRDTPQKLSFKTPGDIYVRMFEGLNSDDPLVARLAEVILAVERKRKQNLSPSLMGVVVSAISPVLPDVDVYLNRFTRSENGKGGYQWSFVAEEWRDESLGECRRVVSIQSRDGIDAPSVSDWMICVLVEAYGGSDAVDELIVIS